MSTVTAPQDFAFITSFREFARNTALRKKAIRSRKPIVVEDKREKEFYFFVPPEFYQKMNELYEDWRDSRDLKAAIEESKIKGEKGMSLEEFEQHILETE